MDGKRIQYLDGLRGIAILMVITYHAFARWPNLVPYGSKFAEFPVFKFGWLGVQLFFLISGFVILMTLEKCNGPRDFIWRRWLRLFPAMAICTALIFATAGYFHERPAGVPSLISLVPGLLFIEPGWVGAAVGSKVPVLEGAFWSLFVEFKFYIIAAALFFSCPRKYFTLGIAGLFAFAVFATKAPHVPAVIAAITKQLSLQHFGYFAAGAEFFLAVKTGSRAHLVKGIGLSLVAPLGTSTSTTAFLAACAVSLLFAAAITISSLQAMLGARWLVFVGFVSYPLYLLHENAMIATLIKLAGFGLPSLLLPTIPVAALMLVSYAVAKNGEPVIRSLIKRTLGRRVAVA
jgi:peptidoglycan/LPS O-acetylase OafA/YrhL